MLRVNPHRWCWFWMPPLKLPEKVSRPICYDTLDLPKQATVYHGGKTARGNRIDIATNALFVFHSNAFPFPLLFRLNPQLMQCLNCCDENAVEKFSLSRQSVALSVTYICIVFTSCITLLIVLISYFIPWRYGLTILGDLSMNVKQIMKDHVARYG